MDRYHFRFLDWQLGNDTVFVEQYHSEDTSFYYYTPYRLSADGTSVQQMGDSMELFGNEEEPNALLLVPPRNEQDNTEFYVFGCSNSGVDIVRKKNGVSTWEQVKPYIPTVLINGGERGEGTAYEGYNLLTGGFRCLFTTNGKISRFYLPRKPLNLGMDEAVRIVYTNADGQEYTFTSTEDYENDYAYSAGVKIGDKTVYARVDYKRAIVTFWTSKTDTSNAAVWIPPDGEKNNNLSIVAYQKDVSRENRIGGMRFSVWFGGGIGGLKSGTRLFVSGHPEYPGLVHWSDMNQPLYFPENNYAYVGGTNEKVTAFGKQSDMLVIFKEHSLYAMTYAAGEYSTSDVLKGEVVDVAVASALFPIKQLHPAIGCDRPETIALCQNRLVWATSDGKVQMLLSSAEYSDSNVRELGQQIEERLCEAMENGDIIGGVSWKGRYVLLVGNTAFLLDYSDTAFLRYGSYDDDRRAQRNLPWHIWDLAVPQVGWLHISSQKGHLCLFGEGIDEESGAVNMMIYCLENIEDDVPKRFAMWHGERCKFESCAVKARFSTLLFHFGRPERYKRIGPLFLSLDGEKGTHFSLSYFTENGKTVDPAAPTVFAKQNGMQSYRFVPCFRRVCRFGLQGESVGPIAIGEALFTYHLGGGVR